MAPPPVEFFTLQTPEPGACVKGKSVTIRGTVKDPSLDAIIINGRRTPLKNGAFVADCPLVEEENEIYLLAKDKSGKEHRKFFDIIVDNLAPTIEMEEGGEEILTRKKEYTVKGFIRDKNPEKIIGIQGKLHKLSDTSYSVPISLAEGPNEIEIKAWDRAGKPWKWFGGYFEHVEIAPGEKYPVFAGMYGMDEQVGFIFSNIGKTWVNTKNYNYNHFKLSNIRRLSK